MTNKEPKTLEDIRHKWKAMDYGKEVDRISSDVNVKELRQEAIKWIKEDFEDINKVVNDLVKQELIILECQLPTTKVVGFQ